MSKLGALIGWCAWACDAMYVACVFSVEEGIHISSRQVPQDDYKVLRTSIKITNLSGGQVNFKEQVFFLQFLTS